MLRGPPRRPRAEPAQRCRSSTRTTRCGSASGCRDETLDELRSYWARALEGAPELLRLPTDRPRLPVQRHEGSHHRIALNRELADGVVALGREQGATLFMTMLAAFSTLLYRIERRAGHRHRQPDREPQQPRAAGADRILHQHARAAHAAGRQSLLPRSHRARSRRRRWAPTRTRTCRSRRSSRLVAPKRDPGYNPLFQVNFRAQATERPVLALAGLEVEPLAVDIGFSRFDLALELELGADGPWEATSSTTATCSTLPRSKGSRQICGHSWSRWYRNLTLRFSRSRTVRAKPRDVRSGGVRRPEAPGLAAPVATA